MMSVLEKMSSDLLLDPETIISILNKGRSNYRRIVIDKERIVWAPSPELKILQYWVSDYLKSVGDAPSESATAYERGSSIVNNALCHASSNHVLRLDIKRFFPSIGESLITKYLIDHTRVELSEDDLRLILRIVMLGDGLAMGAVSSPMLANRVMLPVDDSIRKKAAEWDSEMIYTRYSDDLFFSSANFIEKRFIGDIRGILQSFGFKLNDSKTRIMGKGSNKWMAGVALNSCKSISLGQKRKAQLRHDLYHFVRNDNPTREDAWRMLGHLAFAKQIEPRYVDKMLLKYASYGESVVRKIYRTLNIGHL